MVKFLPQNPCRILEQRSTSSSISLVSSDDLLDEDVCGDLEDDGLEHVRGGQVPQGCGRLLAHMPIRRRVQKGCQHPNTVGIQNGDLKYLNVCEARLEISEKLDRR